MNLIESNWSYFLGFIQADGHLQKGNGNKGKLSIELSIKDRDILEKFQSFIPFYSAIHNRTRTTNYKENYTSCTLSVYNVEFRDILVKWGMLYGKKSNIISPPSINYNSIDYWRGFIDGDGSLGITSHNLPFLSIITNSDKMAKAYIKFLSTITHKVKTTTRNKRDNVYNIMITKSDMINVARHLYYNGCIALQRKLDIVQFILSKKAW
jgi:DNA-binding transcriptional regulator WhiA